MIGRIDPEGVETRVVHDLIDFSAKNVLEIGCGDGRLTWRFADAAASVLAAAPRTPRVAAQAGRRCSPRRRSRTHRS